jgi:hypothetical protein
VSWNLLKEALGAASFEDREHAELLLQDRAEEIERAKARPPHRPSLRSPTGKHTPSKLYLAEWKAQVELAPKTKEW